MKSKLKYYIPTSFPGNFFHIILRVFLIAFFISNMINIALSIPILSITNNSITNDTSTTKIFLNNSQSISFYVSSNEPNNTFFWYSNGTHQVNNLPNFTISYTKGTYHYVIVNATNLNGTSNSIKWGLNVYPAVATQTISLLNETPGTNLMNAMATNDFKGFIVASIDPYLNLIGVFFYAIVWGLYFAMIWIKQGTLNMPMIIGIIFGGLLISFLPATYQLIAQVLIVFGIVAVIYVFFKGRG